MLKKILLIDDEPDFVAMITDLLETNGYKVFTANNGENGIKKCKECCPDLILLDIMLPKIDGLEVLYRLRNIHPDTKNTPIIMITGKTEIESFFQAKGFGATEYIIKPFHPEDLLSLIAKHLASENPELNNSNNVV